MNQLIIIGIALIIFEAMCLVTAIIENFSTIRRFVKAVVQVIAERVKNACKRKFGA